MSNISGISSSLASAQSLSVSAANSLLTATTAASQLENPFSNLGLSTNQQTQIQQILQNASTQNLTPSQVLNEINNVLTPAQQSQLQTNISSLQKQHHHHGGTSNAGSNSETDAFGIPTSISSASNSGSIAGIAAAYAAQSQLQNESST